MAVTYLMGQSMMSTATRRSLPWILITVAAAFVMFRSILKASRQPETVVSVSHHPKPERFRRASIECTAANCGQLVDRLPIVIFTDFNCAFCMQAEPVFEEFLTRRFKKGEVHWRYLASAVSQDAATIALCNENRADVFDLRSDLFNSVRGRRDLPKWVQSLKEDKCTASKATVDDLNKDRRDFSALEIPGVPAILVGKTLIVGVPTQRLLDSAYTADMESRSALPPAR